MLPEVMPHTTRRTSTRGTRLPPTVTRTTVQNWFGERRLKGKRAPVSQPHSRTAAAQTHGWPHVTVVPSDVSCLPVCNTAGLKSARPRQTGLASRARRLPSSQSSFTVKHQGFPERRHTSRRSGVSRAVTATTARLLMTGRSLRQVKPSRRELGVQTNKAAHSAAGPSRSGDSPTVPGRSPRHGGRLPATPCQLLGARLVGTDVPRWHRDGRTTQAHTRAAERRRCSGWEGPHRTGPRKARPLGAPAVPGAGPRTRSLENEVTVASPCEIAPRANRAQVDSCLSQEIPRLTTGH